MHTWTLIEEPLSGPSISGQMDLWDPWPLNPKPPKPQTLNPRRLKDFNQLPSDFAENKHTFETPKGGGVRIRLEKGAPSEV